MATQLQSGKVAHRMIGEEPDARVAERWVDRARAGDPDALERILDAYRDRCIRLAAHILRRPDEAEDAVQEAFVRAFRRLHTFRGGSAFYTWLYAIVVRVCLNRMREPGFHRHTLPQQALDPTDRTAEVDTHLLVETLMDRLTPPMRAALSLREIDGLDYEEIAAMLRIPVGTVRSRLHTARQEFARLWREAQKETDDAGTTR